MRDVWKEIATRIIGGVPVGTPYVIDIIGGRYVYDGGRL